MSEPNSTARFLEAMENTTQTQDQWAIERQETITKLREVCEELGDNDWPDNLHLADIIEKHLYRYL